MNRIKDPPAVETPENGTSDAAIAILDHDRNEKIYGFQGGTFPLPRWSVETGRIFSVSWPAARVYLAMARCCNWTTGKYWSRYDTLCARAQIQRGHLVRAFDELEAAYLIVRAGAQDACAAFRLVGSLAEAEQLNKEHPATAQSARVEKFVTDRSARRARLDQRAGRACKKGVDQRAGRAAHQRAGRACDQRAGRADWDPYTLFSGSYSSVLTEQQQQGKNTQPPPVTKVREKSARLAAAAAPEKVLSKPVEKLAHPRVAEKSQVLIDTGVAQENAVELVGCNPRVELEEVRRLAAECFPKRCTSPGGWWRKALKNPSAYHRGPDDASLRQEQHRKLAVGREALNAAQEKARKREENHRRFTQAVDFCQRLDDATYRRYAQELLGERGLEGISLDNLPIATIRSSKGLIPKIFERFSAVKGEA